MKKNFFVIFTLVSLISACAKTSNGSGSDGSAGQGSASGPAAYHSVYSDIEDTIVTLQNYRLRLNDGSVISIPTAPTEVDLQDLVGIGKGLVLDLAGVTFPGGAITTEIVEVEVDVVGTNARIVSSDNTTCALKTPKRLNLYTLAPMTVIAGESYLIKVAYSALNSIQIDILGGSTSTKVSQSGKKHRHSRGHTDQDCDSDSDSNDDDKNPPTTGSRTCELVNQRQPIQEIVRPIDEA
ncbi:MAG: hypothetical protein AB7F86_20195 [Bdellovibrionales bacterium]